MKKTASELKKEAYAARNGIATIKTADRYLHEITEDCLDALKKENKKWGNPKFFLRGNDALSIVRVKNQNDKLFIEPLGRDSLKGELDRCARFVKLKREVLLPARVPDDVVADILCQSSIDLPQLSGVSGVPMFVRGGKLLLRDGYDPESGLFLSLNGGCFRDDMPVKEALALLQEELFGDFPFADAASKAHAIAITLQPFVRRMIEGPVPLYLTDAPGPATGKGMFLEAASIPFLGYPVEADTLPKSEEEMDKRLTAFLLQGVPYLRFDNVLKIKSAKLSAALTARNYRGRILGVSKTPSLKNDVFVWAATGNNPELSREITRRIVPIRLDAECERPENRTGFKHDPLITWALENRIILANACLSLINSWVVAGMPIDTKPFGSFESWVKIIGGILNHIGVDGFLENRDTLQSRDVESSEWASLFQLWGREMGIGVPVRAKAVLEIAKGNNLLVGTWTSKTEAGEIQRMAHALIAHDGRVFGDLKLKQATKDSATGNFTYLLVEIKTPETPDLRKESHVSGVSGVLNAGEVQYEVDESECDLP